MPVSVQRRKGKWRLIEPSGKLARRKNGKPVDGGGHSSQEAARRQQRAINSG